MRLKVYGHKTRPTNTQALCETCRYSTKVIGQRFSDDFIKCHQLDTIIKIKVVECDSYFNHALPTFDELSNKSWTMIDGEFYSPIEMMDFEETRKRRMLDKIRSIPSCSTSQN